MKAILYDRYGGPEVLALREVDPPALPDDGLRVRVRAAALNALDWYGLGRMPLIRLMKGLVRPNPTIPGFDFAGTVEAVGPNVTRFRPGDDVFGVARGTLAELVSTTPARVARKPPGVTFEQAASLPVAGLTALQGLRDHARVRPGQKVLVHGASGGVGTFAVSIAKALGAQVTAVCSARHVERARELGADAVIDYAKEDFTQGVRRYDVLFNAAGGRAWSACRRVLAPHAVYVPAGGPRDNRWIGPLGHLVALRLGSLGATQRVTFFMAKVGSADLDALGGLVASGAVRPVIETFALADAAEAFRRLGEGHADGKFVITL